MQYTAALIIVTLGLFSLDYYVYRSWRRFARGRTWGWTLPVYQLFMWLMPATLPLYFYFYRWWEVEPLLARAAFFGFWAVYYVPKVPIVIVLLVKDAVRATRYVRGRLHPSSRRPEAASSSAPPDDIGSLGLDQPSGQATLTRGEFLRQMGWAAAAVPFIATGYGVLRTLYDFRVYRVDVPIAGLPRALDGLTIAQISDLHAGSFLSPEPMRDAAEIVRGLRPDVIAVTGDWVNHDVGEMPIILPSLKRLEADLGVFGCLGNHDHYAQTDGVVGRLRETPVDLLINEHRTLEIDGAKLHVIGTDNTGFRQRFGDLPRAMDGIEPGDESVQILLAHDPSYWDNEVRPGFEEIDLMLCGHTHGGQFGVELGPLKWGLARIRYHRWAGLYREPRASGNGEQFLYVNRGLGTVGPPIRLGIPPEITLLTLRRAVA